MLTQMQVLRIIIAIVTICALIAILSLRLLNAEKINKRKEEKRKRKEEKRIDDLKFIPGQIHFELLNLYRMLYEYMGAFPEEIQDCQELLSHIDEAMSEAYRLQEKSGHFFDVI